MSIVSSSSSDLLVSKTKSNFSSYRIFYSIFIIEINLNNKNERNRLKCFFKK